jgi:hypothetical protein
VRTPSRAALALAMGVFAAGGITVAGTAVATAAPGSNHSHSQHRGLTVRALHSVHFAVPGTGVRMTSTVDDAGNVVSTSAGDDDGDEVGIDDEGVELGDDDDAAEPVEVEDEQGEDGDDQGEDADEQGDDSDDQGADADDQGEDDQGDDQGEQADDQGDDDQGDEVGDSDDGGDDQGSDEGDDDQGGDSGDDD